MLTVNELQALRGTLAKWRRAGKRIAFVPTMGNLHTGHLELMSQARSRAERVVASIFVNPMQFGEGEDFDAYPRTLEQDQAKLEERGVDLLFAPALTTLYPTGSTDTQTRVEVPGLSDQLCGASRPRHFVGVATVVCKFFNMVQPDLAVFGQKDFQQLMVIRRMVTDLAIPIDIVGVETVREPDGLAMSSRNGYLSPAERALAPRLYDRLVATAEAIKGGDRDYTGLEAAAEAALREAGFRPDYFAVRRAEDLTVPGTSEENLVILAAAFLGTTRLIDNLRV
jgi:pantoate--beta-alanine ligase